MKKMHETFARLMIAAKELKNFDTQADIARALNIPEQNVTNWKSRGVPQKDIINLSRLWGFQIEWLRDGTLPMRSTNISPQEVNVIDSHIEIKRCPLISWVRAGELCDVGHVYSKEDAEEWLVCGAPHGDRTFALRVVGDSMSPEYQEGWHIFVDPDVQAQHNDDVIVRDQAGNATFKRLQITPEGTFLLALNPDYPNRVIRISEDSYICGVVVYSGKRRR